MSIKWLSISLALVALVVFAAPLCAQESAADVVDQYTVYRLPEGFRWSEDGAEDENGDPVVNTYQCYDLEDYKYLLMMDNDLRAAEATSENLTIAVTELQAGVAELREALAAEELAASLFQADRNKWFAAWEKENEAKHRAENKPSFSWIPWTIAGVTSAIAAGLIIGVASGG